MDKRLFNILAALSVVPLIALCLFTGGASSAARFAFFPLMTLLALRLSPNAILVAGAGFFGSYVLMLSMNMPSGSPLTSAATELICYAITTWGAAVMARSVAMERNQFRLAEAAFQGLSNELSHRSLNLQATLDALSQAHSKLQYLDRNKTTFLANIAHELRTPLSGIRSYSEILLTYDDLEVSTQREFLEIIQNESVRLTNLVNDLLNLIKIETGNIELAIGRVDGAELIERCIKVMKPTAEAKGLALESSVPHENVFIKADPGQMTQVIINLLNNAVKFTQQGGITVKVRPKGEFAEFSVTDSGEGLFPDEQEKIFDEFYRVLDSVPNRPAGTGLGLSICKKIVEFHGGIISVESRIGAGSTFSFTIPLFGRDDHALMIDPEKRARRIPEEFRPILVVMRNTVKRMCLRKGLENVGYKTYGAVTYEKAGDLVKSSPVDLIIGEITDNADGLELLSNTAHREGTPFYMAHFHAEPPEVISMAVNGYIWKPFERHQLLQALKSLPMKRNRITIISPDMDESRMLQMLLGVEGYTISLFSNDARLVHSCTEFNPDVIIIGSFDEQHLGTIVRGIKATEQVANIPLILALAEKPRGHIKLVTTPLQDDKPLLFGLSPLIQEIEGAIFK